VVVGVMVEARLDQESFFGQTRLLGPLHFFFWTGHEEKTSLEDFWKGFLNFFREKPFENSLSALCL
jgi:hypothetical protein